MKMKNLAIVLLFLVVLAVTSSCDRIASIPPISAAVTPTGSGVPFPVGQAPDPTEMAKILSTTVSNMAAAKDAGAPTATSTTAGSGASTATSTSTSTSTPAGVATATPTSGAPTATPTPVPTAVPAVAVPASYALARGEWAICVARRFNLNIDAFFALNNINMNTNYLPEGYVLYLPSGGGWSYNYGPRYWHPHPGIYYVQPGDTINHIACFFGDLSPADIEAANGLHGSYALYPGERLSIP